MESRTSSSGAEFMESRTWSFGPEKQQVVNHGFLKNARTARDDTSAPTTGTPRRVHRAEARDCPRRAGRSRITIDTY